MSRTKHHNAPKKARLLKPLSHHTGWTGDGCWAQNGRKFIARMEHRINRRWIHKDVAARVLDALFGKDVPLLFEREYVQEQPYVPAQPKLPATRWKRCSSTGLRPNFRSV